MIHCFSINQTVVSKGFSNNSYQYYRVQLPLMLVENCNAYLKILHIRDDNQDESS
jgi:hypothetical protein